MTASEMPARINDEGRSFPKCALVATYFGELPPWFSAFLLSCERNPDFSFLLFTDQSVDIHPPNVRPVQMTISELNARATALLGFDVRISRPYKACDLRPAFAVLFAEELREYEFWGHCDIDVIFGDLRHFIQSDIDMGADVISPRRQLVCGHFTLFRNIPLINELFKADEHFQRILNSDVSGYYDEVGMSALVRRIAIPAGANVQWSSWRFNYRMTTRERRGLSSLPPVRQRWHWQDGKLFHRAFTGRRSEVMYLHFMTWKQSLRTCTVDYPSTVREFTISFDGIDAAAPRFGRSFRAYPLRQSLRILKQYLRSRF